MKPLYAGCTRSEITVLPANWQSSKASTKSPWRIYYRFYDPAFRHDPKLWGKMIAIKGMNRFSKLQERQEVTRALLTNELHILDDMGWNPITRQWMAPSSQKHGEINPDTNFISALKWAHARLDGVRGTLTDIRSVINGVARACAALYCNQSLQRYDQLPVSEIKRKHLKTILEHCAATNPRWSNNRHNKYKAYLSMLFSQLLEAEAVETNPTREIACKKKTHKLRAILSPEEELLIDQRLRQTQYHFWRFLRVFFDSQARVTELMQLRKSPAVRIQDQEFTVMVRKGKQVREDIRVISKSMMPVWEEIWAEAKPGEFLFSKFLRPGPHPIRADQIGRRWVKHVKAGLGINKDFYSLKHLSTDKMALQYGLQLASAGAGHTNTGTTLKYYAVGENRRRLELLKQKDVSFGA